MQRGNVQVLDYKTINGTCALFISYFAKKVLKTSS